jgi:hypothetical protein
MRVAYSCLVDGTPKFEWQAVNLCVSLSENAGVMPEDIKLHITPSVSSEFRDYALDRCMTIVPTDPFPGEHAYCNKIQQMFSSAFAGYTRVVLCDCDLYFMQPLALELIAAPAAGRVVDRPIPPFALLQSLYEARGVTPSPVTDVDVGFPMAGVEHTLTSNWNGGLYVLDREQMNSWGRVWFAHATGLLAELEVLGDYRNHVDQISWALTLDQLSIPYARLPGEHNYPIHFGAIDSYRHAPPQIASFHYHHRMDALGRLQPTGIDQLDHQIYVANRRNGEILSSRLIRDDTLFRLFQRWQSFCGSVQSDGVTAARAAFQNPRYLRHNARRLEHLASLNLDLWGKSVLEFGAGIGDHSLFFLDRDCHVISIEPREENVACILQRHAMEAATFPKERHLVIRCGIEDSGLFLGTARFPVVHNYGLLYHLSDPESFLRQSASRCEGLYLLETAVCDLIEGDAAYVEDKTDLTNSFNGACRLLSRREILDILSQCLPYVYIPVMQPAHEQFPKDWTAAPVARSNRHRAVFVGSTSPLSNPFLTERVFDRHDV